MVRDPRPERLAAGQGASLAALSAVLPGAWAVPGHPVRPPGPPRGRPRGPGPGRHHSHLAPHSPRQGTHTPSTLFHLLLEGLETPAPPSGHLDKEDGRVAQGRPRLSAGGGGGGGHPVWGQGVGRVVQWWALRVTLVGPKWGQGTMGDASDTPTKPVSSAH